MFLDPFMGTANLGVQVIKRGGIFFGYEIDTGFYETAKRKLEKASPRFKI
jgi:DNA modification methylase